MLNSSDPFAPPSVHSNILGHRDDVSRMAACIAKEREVAEVLSNDLGFNLTEVSIVGRDTQAELMSQVCVCPSLAARATTCERQ